MCEFPVLKQKPRYRFNHAPNDWSLDELSNFTLVIREVFDLRWVQLCELASGQLIIVRCCGQNIIFAMSSLAASHQHSLDNRASNKGPNELFAWGVEVEIATGFQSRFDLLTVHCDARDTITVTFQCHWFN